jgi:hypothetical protein
MKAFKDGARAFVGLAWYVALGYAFAVWAEQGVDYETAGGLFALFGVFMAAAWVWLVTVAFLIWLTDGKWNIEEGGENEDDGKDDVAGN